MARAYADETGDYQDPDSRFVGIVGIVASAQKWEAFDAERRHVCRDEAIELPFHSVDFANRRKQFGDKRWSEDHHRRRLMMRLTAAIAKTEGFPVGAIVPKADFDSLPQLLRERTRDDPYFFAFQRVTREMTMAAGLMAYPPDPVSMTFARKDKYVGKAKECWNAIKLHHPLGGVLMGDFSVGEQSDDTPLQAADLWSYELGRHFRRPPLDPTKPRWPLGEFVRQASQRNNGHQFFTLCDREFLLKMLMTPEEIEHSVSGRSPDG